MIYFLLFSLLNSGSISSSSVTYNYIYVTEDKYNNGYTEQRYEEILDKFIEVYTPLIQERNGSFNIMSDWGDGAVNMWAWRWGDEYWLEVPGGMARYHLINEEAFVLSMCHELGHLLGGSPGNEPISYEGQSDYFSSAKCIKRMLPEIVPEKKLIITHEVKEACEQILHIDKEICYRALEGALSLSSYYAELEKVVSPLLSTPDKNKVSTTLTVHPPAQCRLDTFYAGLRCDADIDEAMNFGDINTGSCQLKADGYRPHCWFK